MNENSNEGEPKIIVDDDWKAQVAREKEQMKSKASKSGAEEDEKIPPASFPMLVTTFATQALASLGFLPDPITKKPMVNRPLAKHFIDMLSVIEEKTKGNLEDQESAMLTETLHQLRMAFVVSPKPAKDAEITPAKPTLELP